MNKLSVKNKAVHKEIFIFDLSKTLKVKNIHFNLQHDCESLSNEHNFNDTLSPMILH